jgi:hypothetical protein
MIPRIIILILSSQGEVYDKLKEYQTNYLNKFVNSNKLANFFFVEFTDTNNTDYVETTIEKGNTLYVKGTESINPGMIIKTSEAMKYINNHYDYDFIFRTNLSTFINVNNLVDFTSKLSKVNTCAGFSFSGFITGTGIIMSRDVSQIVAHSYVNFNYNNIHEDVLISTILGHFKVKYVNPDTDYSWGLIIDNETSDSFPNFIYYTTYGEIKQFDWQRNTLHWRIKNGNDRNLDLEYFKILEHFINSIEL